MKNLVLYPFFHLVKLLWWLLYSYLVTVYAVVMVNWFNQVSFIQTT